MTFRFPYRVNQAYTKASKKLLIVGFKIQMVMKRSKSFFKKAKKNFIHFLF